MKTYIVSGVNWEREVEVDDQLFETNGESCIEAATRVLEKFQEFEDYEDITQYLIVNEKDSSNFVIVSTATVLRNAGMHEAAEVFKIEE